MKNSGAGRGGASSGQLRLVEAQTSANVKRPKPATPAAAPRGGVAKAYADSEKRTLKLDGVELPYALSDRQLDLVCDEAHRRGEKAVDVACRMAFKFLEADWTADRILDYAARSVAGSAVAGNSFALRMLQSMLDDGSIDALTILSLIDVAANRAMVDKQRSVIAAKHAPASRAKLWVEHAWQCRAPGSFSTRDKFVEWCFEHCPHDLKKLADHDRIRDKWVPAGKATEAGRQHGRPEARIGADVLRPKR